MVPLLWARVLVSMAVFACRGPRPHCLEEELTGWCDTGIYGYWKSMGNTQARCMDDYPSPVPHTSQLIPCVHQLRRLMVETSIRTLPWATARRWAAVMDTSLASGPQPGQKPNGEGSRKPCVAGWVPNCSASWDLSGPISLWIKMDPSIGCGKGMMKPPQ